MAKNSSVFVCQNCGWSTGKWAGQCADCKTWNLMVEEIPAESISKKKTGKKQKIEDFTVSFSQVDLVSASKSRLSTNIDELDRVLGGEKSNLGMVPGAVMLIGGEPGIGKSTLLTQMVVGMLQVDKKSQFGKESVVDKKFQSNNTEKISQAKNQSKSPSQKLSQSSNQKFMYVCGEENPSQVVLRIERISKQFETKLDIDETKINQSKTHKPNISEFNKPKKSLSDTVEKISKETPQYSNINKDNLIFVTTSDVDAITQAMQKIKPSCVVVDSIQTVTTTDLNGTAGSVGQIRECAERLTTAAKALHIPLFLVGHVTKEGVISGPKVLEHIVDSVLELTGDRTGDLRILRAIKNRFGATDEVGVFRMSEFGFESVTNPSELFLEYANSNVPGSTTICVMEGTRPLLVEIQALVVATQLTMPRRVGRGIKLPRIQVLSAVLEKHCKLPFGSTDIFASVAGGFDVKEPSIDLGLAVAMTSSLNNKPIKDKTVFIGEVGLLGEIRSVNLLDRRIKEAKRLGYTTIISKKTHKSIKDVLSELNLLRR